MKFHFVYRQPFVRMLRKHGEIKPLTRRCTDSSQFKAWLDWAAENDIITIISINDDCVQYHTSGTITRQYEYTLTEEGLNYVKFMML